jgi:hypothetical protein
MAAPCEQQRRERARVAVIRVCDRSAQIRASWVGRMLAETDQVQHE